GAYRPDMREADDGLIAESELFVDARETTIDEIGELMIPIAGGVITEEHVRGDLYDLCQGGPGRSGPDAITVFKNGGGAHLDLMTARVFHEVTSSR
ncbi:MAG: ornithine cyclodeaminase, partial [Acidobacteriota bacterium]